MRQISLLALSATLALGACATQKPAPLPVMHSGAAASSGAVATAPAAAASVPVAAPAKGGGYLAGDGPGADAPGKLDSIPDAVPKPEPLHRYANRPYSALGKTYTPLQKTGNYKQRGTASWYGKKFHGQRTSIGEIYDMYGMTAAHPTLPIPSYARVTNVANGKSVVVRVNDRGPFLHNRLIDLSYAAAYKLGYINNGSAEVEVESIATGTAPVTAAVTPPAVKVEPLTPRVSMPVEQAGVPTGRIFLQLGAFSTLEGAESFLAKMRDELGDSGKPLVLYQQQKLTKVHLGPYANAAEARDAADKLASRLGFKPFVSKH